MTFIFLVPPVVELRIRRIFGSICQYAILAIDPLGYGLYTNLKETRSADEENYQVFNPMNMNFFRIALSSVDNMNGFEYELRKG